MKPLHAFTLTMLLLTGISLQAQPLDTLFYDDFVDNRKGWKTYDDEDGRLLIEDGYLLYEPVQGRAGFRLNHYRVPVHMTQMNPRRAPLPDSFYFEMHFEIDALNMGGLVFNHFVSRRGRLTGYTALVTDVKGLRVYSYESGEALATAKVWRDIEVPRDSLVLAVSHGNGQYHFWMNGGHLGTMRSRWCELWERWGWVVKGPAKLRIGHMLVMGKRPA